MRREMKPVINAGLEHRDEYELAEDESLKLGRGEKFIPIPYFACCSPSREPGVRNMERRFVVGGMQLGVGMSMGTFRH
jgi:hypothetical protein